MPDLNTNIIFDSNDLEIGQMGPETLVQGFPLSTLNTHQQLKPVYTVTKPDTKVDCGAFWYQDFGLEHTRAINNTQQFPSSWIGWYDWRWNHKSNTTRTGATYYADRHPMLGWYRGDDANVLDWQVKWMLEHGVKFTILQQRKGTLADINDQNNPDYWIHQLFKHVKNTGDQGMQFALWLPAGVNCSTYYSNATTYAKYARILYQDQQFISAVAGNLNNTPNPALDTQYWIRASIPDTWVELAEFYLTNKSKIYTVNYLGKRYPLIYQFEGESSRAGWATNTYNYWLKQLGQYLVSRNPDWEGIAVLSRNSPLPSVAQGVTYSGLVNYDQLLNDGVLLLRGDYTGLETSLGAVNTYQSIIDNCGTLSVDNQAAPQRRVYTAITSLESREHPSNYAFTGHTPQKFKALLDAIIPKIVNNQAFPLLTVNNVSEWAESGPGLIPNRLNGFDYLISLKQALT